MKLQVGNELSSKYVVYTDASYNQDTDDGGCAFLIISGGKEIIRRAHYCQHLGSALSAELTAINMAVSYIRSLDDVKSISVISDSSSAINIWNGKANKDNFTINFTWIRGHSQITNPNIIVDFLAGLSARLRRDL